MQRHLVLPVEGSHPHQVLDQEDDAGLAGVLGELREEVEVGSGSLLRVLDRVSFEKFWVRFTCENAFRQISGRKNTKLRLFFSNKVCIPEVLFENASNSVNIAFLEQLLRLVRVALKSSL